MLNVMSITDPNAPFELAEAGPFDVGGGTATSPTCHLVAVEFRPATETATQVMSSVNVTSDDNGRPMVLINWNTDMGDGVE